MNRLLSMALLGLVLVFTSPAFAAKRVAFVVGNDDYAALPKLQKAVKSTMSPGSSTLVGLAVLVTTIEGGPSKSVFVKVQVTVSPGCRSIVLGSLPSSQVAVVA